MDTTCNKLWNIGLKTPSIKKLIPRQIIKLQGSTVCFMFDRIFKLELVYDQFEIRKFNRLVIHWCEFGFSIINTQNKAISKTLLTPLYLQKIDL